MTSLDDLLNAGAGDGDGRRGGHRGRWRWLGTSILVAGAGTLVILGIMGVAFHRAVPWILVFVGLLTLRLLGTVLNWVNAQQVPKVLLRRVQSPSHWRTPGENDGVQIATGRWSSRLAWFGLQGGGQGRFASTLQPRLVMLIDDRVRSRHGVTRASDPARYRAHVGELLWGFVSQPAMRSPTTQELAVLVTHMEEI